MKDLGLDIRDPNVRYYQTNRALEYHTDSVDIVGLLCLQTAKAGGASYLASSMTVFNEVLRRRPDVVAALFEPFPTDRRGEVPEGMKPWFDIPIYHCTPAGSRAFTCASTSSRRRSSSRRRGGLRARRSRRWI